MAYFIIRSGEDGTNIEELTMREILDRISPDEDGEYYYGNELMFLEKIPEDDKGYWIGVPENATVIIEGKIVIPKKIEVTTKYEL